MIVIFIFIAILIVIHLNTLNYHILSVEEISGILVLFTDNQLPQVVQVCQGNMREIHEGHTANRNSLKVAIVNSQFTVGQFFRTEFIASEGILADGKSQYAVTVQNGELIYRFESVISNGKVSKCAEGSV